MKNTIITTIESMTESYADSMGEFIEAHRTDVSLAEYADDLADFALTLQRLTSKDLTTQLNELRKMTQSGCTLMMLPDDMDRLETWSRNQEDFQVAVFRASGNPVGVIHREQLEW